MARRSDDAHGALSPLEVYASAEEGARAAAAAILGARLGDLGADAGFIATVSPDRRTVEVARVTPFSRAPVRLAFPADAPYPLAAAIRRDEAFFISSNDTLACDHPGLIRTRGEDHACATVPLHGARGMVIGSANVSFEDPREFSDADRTEIVSLCAACAQAIVQSLDPGD
jgi:GAF domain-containing protein